jgi:hypothetical protein
MSHSSGSHDHWCDPPVDKSPSSTRVVFQNCGGLPLAKQRHQNDRLVRFSQDFRIDVMGLAEVNINWSRLPIDSRLHGRFRGAWERVHILNSNLHGDSEPFQRGGTALFSFNQLVSRIRQSGTDLRRLGRWCWVRYEGTNGLGLRVITGYRPCRNTTGPMSVYNQQRRALFQEVDAPEPLATYDADLLALIDAWLLSSDHVILMLDANCTITANDKFIRQLQRRLTEAITQRHGRLAPQTYHRGSTPIDGIWVSPSLLGFPCGYLAFGDGLDSDHRALWLDLPTTLLFGTEALPSSRMIGRKLTLNDPRIVQRYVESCEEQMEAKQLLQQAENLLHGIQGSLSPGQICQWERLDKQWIQIAKEAEQKCRKFKCGAVPWSPEIGSSIRRILYWRLSLKKAQDQDIHAKTVS